MNTTVKDIPAYVLNPAYKMTHIIAGKLEDESFQFRQCFTTKGGAINRLKKCNARFPNVEFKIFSINEL